MIHVRRYTEGWMFLKLYKKGYISFNLSIFILVYETIDFDKVEVRKAIYMKW